MNSTSVAVEPTDLRKARVNPLIRNLSDYHSKKYSISVYGELLQALIDEIDIDGDGQINYEEFTNSTKTS